MLNLPVYIVIVNTALGGAAAVAGLLLGLDQLQPVDLRLGPSWATVGLGWLWTLVWIALAVVGLLFQMRTMDELARPLPRERSVRAQPA